MNDCIALTPREAEALVHTLEAAAQVHRRHQFFVWTQGQFQILLPHGVLVCGTYHRQRRTLMFDHFNNMPLSSEAQAALTDAQGPLLSAAAGQWVAAGGKAIVVAGDGVDATTSGLLQRLRAEAACAQVVVHGVARPQRPNEIESLFAFLISSATPAPRLALILELLLPQVHIVWRHVLAIERSLQATPATAGVAGRTTVGSARQVVTERERQILLWMREGMSNPEIGEVLSISPLTVKNHVQKILRKLNAANRAQAVAQAMSMNLLQLDDGRSGMA